jgi:hypothetical protein
MTRTREARITQGYCRLLYEPAVLAMWRGHIKRKGSLSAEDAERGCRMAETLGE